jgi:tRNA/tmRNA/rRNA uracil-C5-methylase (TrmA/RlmC/RlmD family)
VKRRDIIEFEIDKMEFGGTSVSRLGNRDIYVKGGMTGQKVKASVKKTKSGKVEVKMLELL